MKIGFLGSGNIGSTLAKLAVKAGHTVVMSVSRGPETLTDLVASLGPSATAATSEEAARAGEVVVVTIPLKNYRQVPVEPLVGKIVIDTNNYYPGRDGAIGELDAGKTTTSELLAQHLPQSRIVKAFNSIYFEHLATQGAPKGTPGRRALPICGDDAEAKQVVADLIEQMGFDVADAGPLPEGRRFERDTPAYNKRLTVDELKEALTQV